MDGASNSRANNKGCPEILIIIGTAPISNEPGLEIDGVPENSI
jgi:hypothetical protein